LGRKRSSRSAPRHAPASREVAVDARWAVCGGWLLEAGVIAGVMLVPAAMYTIGRSPFGPPKMAMLSLSAALVLAGFVVDRTALSELLKVARDSRVAWAAGALLGIALLATLTSIDPRLAALGGYPDYRGTLTMVACAVIGTGGAVIAGRAAAIERFWRAVVVLSAGILGFGVLQRLGVLPAGPEGYFKEGMRISSTLGNSSNYGVFLAMLVPLLVQRVVLERERAWRWLSGACAILAVLGLLWALSRGAWLGGLAVFLVWPVMIVWAGRSRRVVNRLGVGLAVVLTLAAVGAAVTPGFTTRASQIVDVQSRTAAWRISAWRSSWQMTLDRPFLGYGPNVFRLAYPAYQEPGQIGGSRGYRTIESAHNVFFDTSTSSGFAGLLVLLALVGLTAGVAFRELARERSGFASAPTAFVALLGGLVSIQFHYVTMDTGPLFAVLIGLIAISEASLREAEPVGAPQWARPVAAFGATLYALAFVAGLGLMAADVAADRAMAAAKSDVPWTVVHDEFARATAAAPWEPQIRRAEGTASTARMLEGYDPVALADGLDALEAVLAETPLDSIVAAERANLLLAAGVKAGDQALLRQAADAFSQVIEQDPNTGIPRAGRAAALLALGRTDEAIAAFQAALERSPRDRTAWSNLAAAYERAGRPQDADRARERAKN